MRYSINILGPHSICNEQESDDGFAMVFKVNQNEKKMYESWILYPMLPKKTVCNFSYCDLTLSDLIIPNTISYMGVSKNRGTTIFGNIHMYIYIYICMYPHLFGTGPNFQRPASILHFFLEPLSLRRPQ